LPRIAGHPDQLLEVVINLVANAIEAMSSVEAGRRLLSVATRSDADRGQAILAVRDTGPGIAPEKVDEIFDAFVTTKPQGMGLGLAICRTIIERHGGKISAGPNGEQQGAVFQLTLPVSALARQHAVAAELGAEPSAT